MTSTFASATRAALVAAAFAGGMGTAQGAARHPDFSGVWSSPTSVVALKTVKGDLPPLKPEALALYRKRVADRAAGKPVGDPVDACLPHGIPRLMYAPYPMLILQQASQLHIVQQANHTQRHIYIGEPLPEDGDPSWLGDSVAQWDGGALVITTIDQNDNTWLDKAGLPHSGDMKVTERLQLVAGGRKLQDAITIDDPKTYTAPWTTVITLDKRADTGLEEFVCSRDHRM